MHRDHGDSEWLIRAHHWMVLVFVCASFSACLIA